MTPDRQQVISSTIEYVQRVHAEDSSGHDWPHIMRVLDMARKLAKGKEVNLFVIELAALLHDVADWKFNQGDEEAGYAKVAAFLSEFEACPAEEATLVLEIIRTMSYMGGTGAPMTTEEGRIVQDADRLDAIGAIGIARCFAYGGSTGKAIYEPSDLMEIQSSLSPEEYKKGKRSSIAHFYDKLLKLEYLMNTDQAKIIARQRTVFLEIYLHQFFREWNVVI